MWRQKPGCRLCMTGQPAQIGGGRRRSTPPQSLAATPLRGSPRRDGTGICAVPWSLRPGRSGRHGAQRRCGGGLRAQPEPLPGPSLAAEATPRCQSQAQDTDGSGSGAGRHRGRAPESDARDGDRGGRHPPPAPKGDPHRPAPAAWPLP